MLYDHLVLDEREHRVTSAETEESDFQVADEKLQVDHRRTSFPSFTVHRMPAAAPAAISQIGESPNHQTASAVATATTISAGCIPRASAIVGTTISATTAGRIPLKAASTTTLWRTWAKKIAMTRMQMNDGSTAPHTAAAAPATPRVL